METTKLQTINIEEFTKQCFGDKDYTKMTPAEILEAIKAQYKDIDTSGILTNTELIARIKEHISNKNLRAAFKILHALDSWVSFPECYFSGDRFAFFKKKGTLVAMGYDLADHGLLIPKTVYGHNAGKYFFHVIVERNGIGCYSKKDEVYALVDEYKKKTDNTTFMGLIKELDNFGKANGKFVACFKTLPECEKVINQCLKDKDYCAASSITEKIEHAQSDATYSYKYKERKDEQREPLIYDNSGADQWKWKSCFQKIKWINNYDIIADLFLTRV